MSISSMLDTVPDRSQESLQNHNQMFRNHSNQVSLSALMSPPNQSLRGDYYNRSQTPDGFDGVYSGNRHRSASGTSMPLERGFAAQNRYSKPYGMQSNGLPALSTMPEKDENDNGVQRTSISSILQRPNSQPHGSYTQPLQARPFDSVPPSRNNWYADPPNTMNESQKSDPFTNAYDTRPPSFRDTARTSTSYTQRSPQLPPPPQPISPELRRPQPNGFGNKNALAGLLNGPMSNDHVYSSHSMMRQDSTQSQSDRSVGDASRFRHFSPFTGFLNAQNGGRTEDLVRKNSDEATHKTIFGLGLESRRGRFSPVPQAVHGAQPQTPVPDAALNGDQGRVFSGLGGGTSSLTPLPGSQSPFKHDDLLLQNSDNLKMSRSSSSIGKRSRKQTDDAGRGPSDQEGRKNGSVRGSKRPKHQNSYKTDLEELAAAQRRSTPVSLTNFSRTPAITTRYEPQPTTITRKTIKVSNVVAQTLRKPRRHLGSFRYDANIVRSDQYDDQDQDSELLLSPKLLASFSADEHLNCTYNIHVSKNWLQEKERHLITSSRHLWGTAIYSDDTDPVAAAMHMGWIQPEFLGVDEMLLSKIIAEQNAKVDISNKELRPPSKPIKVPKGKDIKITCVVMPQLERYDDSIRFGLQSRLWPGESEHTPHDGVSFSILKVEVVDIGPLERKLGRVGKDKKAWSQAQTRQRLQFINPTVSVASLSVQKGKKRFRPVLGKRLTGVLPSPLSNEVIMDVPIQLAYQKHDWPRQVPIAAA